MEIGSHLKKNGPDFCSIQDHFWDSCHVRGFIMEHYTRSIHAQEFFELNLVLKGKGIHYIGNYTMETNVGDIFIIPPNVRHGYEETTNFDVLHILIHPHFWEKYLAELQQLPCFFTLFHAEPFLRGRGNSLLYLHLNPTQTEKLMVHLDLLLQNSDRSVPKDVASRMMCEHLGVLIITELCRFYQDNTGDRTLWENKRYEDGFLRSLSLIYEKYQEKLTIAKLAQTAQMSRTAYLQTFRTMTGTTPAEFLKQHRLTIVKNMLHSTTLSLNEIAVRTGFCDAAHLNRIFTAEEGVSPHQYRKKNQ